MNKGESTILIEFYRMIRSELIDKLRQSRLAPVMSNLRSGYGPEITDLGIVSGFSDQEFIGRFGIHLDKVEDADIAALTLYLPYQETVVMSLGKLIEHIKAASEGKTGLPYFDEWKPTDDTPITEVPVVWSHNFQEQARNLLDQGYRIAKSKSSANELSGQFVTIFVMRKNFS